MPNKMIYVADKDLSLLEQAQSLTGGNLSAAIVQALRKYVEIEEGKQAGFKEITVKVGLGQGRKQRFSGLKVGEWGHSSSKRLTVYRVYLTRQGKYALHLERSAEVAETHDWRAYLGMGEQTWVIGSSEGTLEVFDTLEALKTRVPAELYEMVSNSAGMLVVEDLDI